MNDSQWKLRAACRGRTELFFAKPSERPEARDRREAQARELCLVCPVRWECRDAGRANTEHGFWGAENEVDRARAGFVPVGQFAGFRELEAEAGVSVFVLRQRAERAASLIG